MSFPNRKYFDLNSRNTFNRWWADWDEPKKIIDSPFTRKLNYIPKGWSNPNIDTSTFDWRLIKWITEKTRYFAHYSKYMIII